jgi:hypothetical protein
MHLSTENIVVNRASRLPQGVRKAGYTRKRPFSPAGKVFFYIPDQSHAQPSTVPAEDPAMRRQQQPARAGTPPYGLFRNRERLFVGFGLDTRNPQRFSAKPILISSIIHFPFLP